MKISFPDGVKATHFYTTTTFHDKPIGQFLSKNQQQHSSSQINRNAYTNIWQDPFDSEINHRQSIRFNSAENYPQSSFNQQQQQQQPPLTSPQKRPSTNPNESNDYELFDWNDGETAGSYDIDINDDDTSDNTNAAEIVDNSTTNDEYNDGVVDDDVNRNNNNNKKNNNDNQVNKSIYKKSEMDDIRNLKCSHNEWTDKWLSQDAIKSGGKSNSDETMNRKFMSMNWTVSDINIKEISDKSNDKIYFR